jgi:hypothetical protein
VISSSLGPIVDAAKSQPYVLRRLRTELIRLGEILSEASAQEALGELIRQVNRHRLAQEVGA